ncbi:hypothetical protein Apa02nite_018510 [Actinoplanes palleronii]|uniref:Regulatory protein RecX n=1 Tax=Actinoplanes palleronii TaxID=113570 RepID=A0ABQ4B504_9ACTN|nr:hypothetical protein Apa02nite_018510 [Actinoplanes palleronii]
MAGRRGARSGRGWDAIPPRTGAEGPEGEPPGDSASGPSRRGSTRRGGLSRRRSEYDDQGLWQTFGSSSETPEEAEASPDPDPGVPAVTGDRVGWGASSFDARVGWDTDGPKRRRAGRSGSQESPDLPATEEGAGPPGPLSRQRRGAGGRSDDPAPRGSWGTARSGGRTPDRGSGGIGSSAEPDHGTLGPDSSAGEAAEQGDPGSGSFGSAAAGRSRLSSAKSASDIADWLAAQSGRSPGSPAVRRGGDSPGAAGQGSGADTDAFGEANASGAARPGGWQSGRAGRRRGSGAESGDGGAARKPAQPQQTESERAREICLNQLSARPRTRVELAKALARKEISEEVIAEVLDRYDEVGIIDDAAFARAWVSSRHNGRGLARRALANELRQHGVDAETASEALEAVDDESEAAIARSLVDRKLRTAKGPPEAVFRRLVAMLARKGYPAGVAIGAVKDALAARDAEAAEFADGLDADALADQAEDTLS